MQPVWATGFFFLETRLAKPRSSSSTSSFTTHTYIHTYIHHHHTHSSPHNLESSTTSHLTLTISPNFKVEFTHL
ncbi:hypothetical protein F4810DRAFT_120707 [Camillea tinctor]|nr:hypothetical protein F4810DRAFT_120707 [Camillea tinctor]